MIYTAHRFIDAAALAAARAEAEPVALDVIGTAHDAEGAPLEGWHVIAAWAGEMPSTWAASVIPAAQAPRWWAGVLRVAPAAAPATAAQVDAERDRRIEGGMTWQGVRFQTRLQDRENVAGAAIMALAAMMGGAQPGNLRWHGGAADFVWISEANTLIPFDAPGFFAFAQGMAAHKSAHIFAARVLKDLDIIPADYADDAFWP